MKRTKKGKQSSCRCGGREDFDMDETKGHILAAGRELLLAADGALRFCRKYAETSVPSSSRPGLLDFFQKAIVVADEMGKSITNIPTAKTVAEKVAKPIFEMMGHEMAREKATPKPKKPRRGRAK